MKKVLLVIIDALASRVVRPALKQERLPTLQALTELGSVNWNSTAIFPSITPAATSSLITGRYPSQHGIVGAHFYDSDRDRVHYYGADVWLILSEGIDRFFDDFLIQLNHQQLTADTCQEIVERAGKRAASINYMIFRGLQRHVANTPFLLSLLPGTQWTEEIRGPLSLCLGDFVRYHETGVSLGRDFGLAGRFGFCDASTGELLLELCDRGMPDFTVAYFPDNDFDSHQMGSAQAVATVEAVDRHLGNFFERQGGIEKALAEFAVVVTGDHSQSDLNDTHSDVAIEIGELLGEFTQSSPDGRWDGNEQIMVCPNLRAAQIYYRSKTGVRRRDLVDRLLRCDRVDQVISRETDVGGMSYRVERAGYPELSFVQSNDNSLPADEYGRHWNIRGDLAVVDATLGPDHKIVYRDYPNALERIAGAFAARSSGDIWVTAKCGYEFSYPGAELHIGGGSHGSLHRADSTSPLIAAGLPPDIMLPALPRSVDVAPLCLRVLQVPNDF